jgi:hypothetical protein
MSKEIFLCILISNAALSEHSLTENGIEGSLLVVICLQTNQLEKGYKSLAEALEKFTMYYHACLV